MSLRNFLFMRKHRKACQRLLKDVEKRRQSFEIRDFAKRREAMLRVTRVGSS